MARACGTAPASMPVAPVSTAAQAVQGSMPTIGEDVSEQRCASEVDKTAQVAPALDQGVDVAPNGTPSDTWTESVAPEREDGQHQSQSRPIVHGVPQDDATDAVADVSSVAPPSADALVVELSDTE
eukprot:3803166-Amphidinium_carterae.3